VPSPFLAAQYFGFVYGQTAYFKRQLNSNVRADLPTRTVVQYEFRERAVVANLLSQPLQELEEEQAMKLRMKFIRNLVKYCHRQESRPCGTPREAIGVRLLSEGGHFRIGQKRAASDTDVGAHQRPKRTREEVCLDSSIQEGLDRMRSFDQTQEDVEIISSMPMTFTDHVCLLCIGIGRSRRFKRMIHWVSTSIDTKPRERLSRGSSVGIVLVQSGLKEKGTSKTTPLGMACGIQLRGTVR
jgi:hypothetical protein